MKRRIVPNMCSCEVCGPFTDHIATSHRGTIDVVFRMTKTELEKHVSSMIFPRLEKYHFSQSQLDSLLNLRPDTASDTSTFQVVLGCAGRNYYNMLYKHWDVISKSNLTPTSVFLWAQLISDGSTLNHLCPPDRIIAFNKADVVVSKEKRTSLKRKIRDPIALSCLPNEQFTTLCIPTSKLPQVVKFLEELQTKDQ